MPGEFAKRRLDTMARAIVDGKARLTEAGDYETENFAMSLHPEELAYLQVRVIFLEEEAWFKKMTRWVIAGLVSLLAWCVGVLILKALLG